ncbi:MAG: head maturation protease, ClpP-related [Faecalibacterium sp.]|jgi:ATP-dependent protease ClpP protease subunit|uniref:head maturation protease, ClpP-related n=1 Tax=Faecalibacterium sp. TaxID=1971605 RepID=UPI003A3370F9
MGKPSSKTAPKTVNNKFWKFRNLADGQKAELFLYGDISETSWWGDEVTPKQFADDLAALGDVTEITVYINSGGGDVFAAQAIGNQLERNAATVTVHIDGLCASAATIVACHADKVVAAADSTYMVHPVSMGLCGYLTADEMRNYLKALDTTRESIVSLYAKKTGHDADECAKWMDETNWWTADEAKENGFVDEVDDAEEEAVVENRSGVLFINSVGTHLPFNEAPEFVRNRAKAKTPAARPENNRPAEQPEHNDHGEVKDMEIKTKDDLRKAYPDMVAQIENEATVAERTRIKEIEDSTLPGAEAEAAAAKFEKPVDSTTFAKTMIAAVKAKQQAQSKTYLAQAQAAAQNSGANDIGNPPPADPEPENAENKAFLNAIHKANGVK